MSLSIASCQSIIISHLLIIIIVVTYQYIMLTSPYCADHMNNTVPKAINLHYAELKTHLLLSTHSNKTNTPLIFPSFYPPMLTSPYCADYMNNPVPQAINLHYAELITHFLLSTLSKKLSSFHPFIIHKLARIMLVWLIINDRVARRWRIKYI